jgi:hypothetical protein
VTEDQGEVDRVWEREANLMQANVERKKIYIFIADIKATSLATADKEKTKDYLTSETVPVLWYFTRGTICQQARTIILELIPHAHLLLGHEEIHVLWMPGHGTPEDTDYNVDTGEIVDVAIKVREYEKFHDISVKLGLVKTWFPLGERYATKATLLNELNLVVEALGYYFLLTRVVDLSRVTLRRSSDPANRVAIKGYEQYVYLPGEYRSRVSGGHLLNFHTSRRTREILKQVYTTYLVAPDWELATTTTVPFHKVEKPAISQDGDPWTIIESLVNMKVMLDPRPPRIRSPPPMPYLEDEDSKEESMYLELPERGESKTSPGKSDREGSQPRTSRSRSSPPTSAPSSPLHHQAPTRRSRSVVRGHMVSARLEHMRLQAEKLAITIGQETLDSTVISEAVRRANLRLRQENTSGAIDLDNEESHINRVATLIGYLLSQAQIGLASNL